MHSNTMVLIDQVCDKVILLALQGSTSCISNIINQCSTHLRSIGSRGRRKAVKRCVDVLKKHLSTISIQCYAYRLKHRQPDNLLRYISTIFLNVTGSKHVVLAADEEVSSVAKVLIVHLKASSVKVDVVRLDKDRFGIVEVFGRKALLKQGKSKKLWISIAKELDRLGLDCSIVQ